MRALTKEDSAFMAQCFTQRGVAVAVINYALAPGVRLEEIVAQCRRATVWLYQNATRHGIDVDRITVGGSSAGGHLGAMLLAPEWQIAANVPQNVVKSAALVSGLYDLEPVQPNGGEQLAADGRRPGPQPEPHPPVARHLAPAC